ncbi:Thaumatin-like protein [Thalictrum thalictroides]|uniref:Thaumatin-like protein n=1 Tax=Thalictrum thalictroides TaxID=46969 RepID=A0A7J6VL63_THATH|nr:Thaumatin-like protein [Thalictrum thalictroides]
MNLVCFFVFVGLLFTLSQAATFDIRNQCSYTVWAAAPPGGGRQLTSGQSWTINFKAGITTARIWGRTNCNFDGNGRWRCRTGDCDGFLHCRDPGSPPNTVAEFALNQFNNLDFYDISLVDGFNIPMEFSPTTGGCKNLRCTADINGQCPNELRAPGGCNNPCTVFRTNEFCCTNGQGSCTATNLSRFFKQRCPDAYSYSQDDPTSTFTCAAGATFEIRNQCPYIVWAAASPGGGRQLNSGQSWTLNVNAAGTAQARIWGRTNCNFDASGRGRCQTGDCNGLLECQGWGVPPNTLAEYALNQNSTT